MLNFDVDVKIRLNFDVDGTTMKTASREPRTKLYLKSRGLLGVSGSLFSLLRGLCPVAASVNATVAGLSGVV